MLKTKYAPIIIPTLNRHEHLKACVTSLAKCTHAENTDLYISVDYPPSKIYEEGYDKVLEYVKTEIKGFKSVNIFIQKHNLGTVGNFMFLESQIISKYEFYIATEDDNIFSPCFLDFMNKALYNFKDNPQIISISGYTPIVHKDAGDAIYFSYDNSGWGLGCWTGKTINLSEIPISYYQNILRNNKAIIKIIINYPALFIMLFRMIKNHKNYGDVKFTTYNIMNNTLQVKPNVSLVRNLGNDGSGINCTVNTLFAKQFISNATIFDFPDNKNIKIKHIGKLELWRMSFYPRYINFILRFIREVFRYIYWRLKY